MPVITLTVPETAESVTRPVVFEVVRDLFAVMGLDPQTPIFMPGDLQTTYQVGSTLSAPAQPNTTGFGARVSIDVEESYEEDRILSTAFTRPENLFIFRDDALGVNIRPGYSSTDVALTFKYRATDKVAATRWRDDMRTRLSMGQTERLHSLTYHYLIPKEFLVILKAIHTMREAVDGYGEDYATYFKKYATQRAAELSNLSGQQTAWGVSDTQIRIVGYFDFTVGPEQGSKEDEGDTWTTSITYRFKYDKPIACVMHYPLMVHNQFIPAKYREKKTDRVDVWQNHTHARPLSSAAFAYFEKGHPAPGVAPGQAGVSLPAFDEFIPVAVLPDTLRVFTTLVQLDPVDPTYMFDLNDLGPHWRLDPDILAYFRRVYAKLHRVNRTPFMMSLYEGERLLSPDWLHITPQLKVFTSRAPSLRQQYHVRLGLSRSWRFVDPACWDDLRADGCTLLKMIDAACPALRVRNQLPKLVPGTCHMSRTELAAAIEAMDRLTRESERCGFLTVGQLFVSSHLKD